MVSRSRRTHAARSPATGVPLSEVPPARPRLSEYPSASDVIRFVELAHPDFDSTPFDRALRAFRVGRYKYVWASDDSHELYDLATDPREERNIVNERAEEAANLAGELSQYLESLGPAANSYPVNSSPNSSRSRARRCMERR